MLVQKIKEVPNNIFLPALNEVNSINWDSIKNFGRRKNPVFETSIALNLRNHKLENTFQPTTVRDWSRIIECEDKSVASKYPALYKTAEWIMTEVNGLKLGRVMLVNLLPKGVVALHSDPFEYFEYYSRYHIPFFTNEFVTFSSGENTTEEHMPIKWLSRLNNRLPHMVTNKSNEKRLHLIVDIAIDGGNQIF